MLVCSCLLVLALCCGFSCYLDAVGYDGGCFSVRLFCLSGLLIVLWYVVLCILLAAMLVCLICLGMEFCVLRLEVTL